MYFFPKHQPAFYRVLETIKNEAIAKATELSKSKGIRYVVERLKPAHLGLSDYKIPVNADKSYRVKQNSALFFAGIFSVDTDFDWIRWWEGKKIRPIGEWFVLDIAYLQEKEGVYAGNLKYYQFLGDSSFTFYAHSRTASDTEVDAWFIAFTVVPETERDNAVVEPL